MSLLSCSSCGDRGRVQEVQDVAFSTTAAAAQEEPCRICEWVARNWWLLVLIILAFIVWSD